MCPQPRVRPTQRIENLNEQHLHLFLRRTGAGRVNIVPCGGTMQPVPVRALPLYAQYAAAVQYRSVALNPFGPVGFSVFPRLLPRGLPKSVFDHISVDTYCSMNHSSTAAADLPSTGSLNQGDRSRYFQHRRYALAFDVFQPFSKTRLTGNPVTVHIDHLSTFSTITPSLTSFRSLGRRF